jgi:anti-sigma factor RsiW
MTQRTDLTALLREALPPHSAPASLRDWASQRAGAMGDALDEIVGPRASSPRQRRLWRGAYAAGLFAALAVGWIGHGVAARSSAAQSARGAVLDQLFDSHLRSLQLDHLVDVRSTDRHTVKPWFAGKSDIAPRVLELAPVGFPLIGGRLDYFDGHAVPVLVYGRRQHVINLFVWRAVGDGTRASIHAASRGGYHALSWMDGDLRYCAVSDVDAAELAQFRTAYLAEP